VAHPQPQLDQTVAEVLARWPAAIAVFLRRRMACVGCVMARFDTLREAAESYAVPPPLLLDEVRTVLDAPLPRPDGAKLERTDDDPPH
jgi:hybrid cluster-associated redox disulfide protein